MRDSLRVSLHRNLCFSKFLWHSLSLFWIFVTAVVISLRLLYDDPASSYQELLTRSGHSNLHVRRLRMIAMEVYKSLNNINPEFMWELFQKKETEYNFRDSFKVDIPSFKTLKYGKYSFSYYGAHLCPTAAPESEPLPMPKHTSCIEQGRKQDNCHIP